MKLFKTSLRGNPNVGLYGFCTETYCLLAPDFTKKQVQTIEKVLGVPVHQLQIAHTSLLGALLAGNSEMLLVPNIAFEEELEHLDSLNIPYTVVPTKLTALGNNILSTDKISLLNPAFSTSAQKKIGDALGVKTILTGVADTDIPGSCILATPKGGVVHAFVSDKEIKKFEKALGVPLVLGTVNFGSPYVSSGVLANSNGMIVGDKSTAIEIENIYEALGFLSDDE